MSSETSSLPETHQDFLSRLLAFRRPTQAGPSTSALDTFRREIMEPWKALETQLKQSATTARSGLTESQRATMDRLLQAPDLLGPLGDERTETTHTRLLAWFLNQEDDTGSACAAALCSRLGLPISELTAKSEVLVAPRCRVDLHLQTATHLVYVEAKVDAQERPAQLQEYRAALTMEATRKGLSPSLVFLTLDGREGSSGRADHDLSFEDLLSCWVPITGRDGPTATYLTSYLASVSRHLSGLVQEGPFETWPLGRQLRCLGFLSEVADG